MVPWDEVTVRVCGLDSEVAPGPRVPGRIVALDLYRRTGQCEGVTLGTPVAGIDWSGLEEAIAWLDTQDLVAPAVGQVPRGEA